MRKKTIDHLQDEEVLPELLSKVRAFGLYLKGPRTKDTEPITANERDVKGKSKALPGVPYYKL